MGALLTGVAAATAATEVMPAGHGEATVSSADSRIRDFWLLLAGSSAAALGSRVSTIAYPLLALAITHSPADAGLTGFAAVVPGILLYLPGGLLVDRIAPRRTMLVSECGRGLVIAAVISALVFRQPYAWELAIAAMADQSLRVFAELAERRLTSSLLQPGREAAGLARSEAWGHSAVLVGRPLGGLLFGLARALPFAAEIGSVLVSVVTLLPIRSGRAGDQPAPAGHGYWHSCRLARRDLAEAWRWWRGDSFAKLAALMTAGTTFIGQALIMVFLIDAQSQHRSSIEVGLVLGASGAGGAVGSAVASRLFSRFRFALLHRQLWVWTGALAVLWSAGGHSMIFMALTMATMGFTGALGNIAVDTYLVQVPSRTMLARLVSIDRFTSLVALALGPLVGGIVMQAYGLRVTIALLFVITLVLAVRAYSEPAMRSSMPAPPLDRAVSPPSQLNRLVYRAHPLLVVAALAATAVALSLRIGA